ncbi:hypothetical protein ACXWRS_10690, partial [Streptococcus pyogenes]
SASLFPLSFSFFFPPFSFLPLPFFFSLSSSLPPFLPFFLFFSFFPFFLLPLFPFFSFPPSLFLLLSSPLFLFSLSFFSPSFLFPP